MQRYIFTKEGFTNLYEYSNYYLIQDCVLLHSIVLTLFRNYLNDSINIFIRRNYSQSNLAYQQFLIIEPSQQIDQVLAPRKITNVYYNYFIRLAVTGGLCTCFVHGKVDSNTIINEHFNFIENSNLDNNKWPNFANLNPLPQGGRTYWPITFLHANFSKSSECKVSSKIRYSSSWILGLF
jgi:hypothetical protein